jgi:cytochrome c553
MNLGSFLALCRRSLAAVCLLLGLALNDFARAADTSAGAQLYQKRCASCHGAKGEGTEDNCPQPLAGDKSVGQLARFIARTMPKDEPKKCSREEADQVAAYIYDAFYAKTARARNQAPRIELSRLTVRQYRNAIADLIGNFRGTGRWGEQRGLKGQYFKQQGKRGRNLVLERLDPTVSFDFGTGSPDPKIEPDEFSMRWEGSVLASDTGLYEFIVRTEHSTRLWVNDPHRPVIDASVKSSNDTEHRVSLFLLGGRAYPIRLEFSKAVQGVRDKAQKNRLPPRASIALLWKPPRRAVGVIPTRNLSPERFPETFAVATPFPPDDRSVGYERGTSVSRAWQQATVEGAVEAAGYVIGHLAELAGVLENASDREARLREFCRRFVERAFRRPLTDEQKRFFIDRRFAGVRDPETAVKRVVLLTLTSPQFLYRETTGRDGYDVASRLSFGLWDSLPDPELLKAAAAGRLNDREEMARQAERMLPDLRAHAKLRDFLLHWLKVDQVSEVAKDPARFPGFDEAAVSDLRTSLELFLDDVVWGPAADFRQFFLADTLYLNGRLAHLYGADLPADAAFRKVSLDPHTRAGILSHPYLMTAFAYTASSSPIHRGVFLARGILGLSLRPPPEAFTPLPAELHPELTTRERVALQTRPQACQSCHAVINPLGFTLEQFDAIGRYRDHEGPRPIDASGAYQKRSGEIVRFAGVRDLAAFLAGSEEVREAFVEQLFHCLVQQPVRAYGSTMLPELRSTFARQGYDVRKLTVAILTAAALPPRGGN